MFLKYKIKIFSISNDYVSTLLYDDILADVQLKAYNIKDVNNITAEDQETNRYYILVKKQYNEVKVGDRIEYVNDFGENKKLKITGISLENFISKTPFIEIKASDYD